MAHISAPDRGLHVLLTGVTGFLGKVVLADLVRRQHELGIARISVVVRPSRQRDGRTLSPAERFQALVLRSEIFRKRLSTLTHLVEVVGGDLEQPGCGIAEVTRDALRARVTHIIHCAASVEFDLPILEALNANVNSALNVLELARGCHQLRGMVDVSTAYVTPWRPDPIDERLAHLPEPADDLYRSIVRGLRSEQDLLAEASHPNTYTYTKSIAEHLLSQRRGDVPLCIVRPSVICAAWQMPFPAWIDSPAALAGCLLYASLGVVPALNSHPDTRLDVVPVDVVSDCILRSAFLRPFPKPGAPVTIRHATMGVQQALRADRIAETGARYFQSRPGARKIRNMFLGNDRHGFSRRDLYQRALPTELLKLVLAATRQSANLRRLTRADERVRHLNRSFTYFASHTFDFRAEEPVAPEGYGTEAYLDLICKGIYQHLLQRDETELTLAGRRHDDARNDIRWMRENPEGNWTIRSLGIGMRKVLRRCADSVTWDRPSFERAVEAAPSDALFVLTPSHRSYFDFLLTSYLCFQHPELGIPVPHIAAADDFSRIPLVGELLRSARAFYIPRGMGREVPEVNAQIQQIVASRGCLMFFLEGQRSRSRHVLPPKRGLLRGLQQTGQAFAVLPIAISYDRIPEESAFERELAGADKRPMSLTAILSWLSRLARGDVKLGRVHIACGQVQVLDARADVHGVSANLAGELQRCTATTRFHLRAFLSRRRLPGIDENWLAEAIERRGGRVLDSPLPAPTDCTEALAQTFTNQWMHWFFADALALYPNHPLIADHVARHAHKKIEARLPDLTDGRVRALLDALFAPVIESHSLTLRALGGGAQTTSPKAVVRVFPDAQLSTVEDVFQLLVGRGVLRSRTDGKYDLGAETAELERLRAAWAPLALDRGEPRAHQ